MLIERRKNEGIEVENVTVFSRLSHYEFIYSRAVGFSFPLQKLAVTLRSRPPLNIRTHGLKRWGSPSLD